MLDEEGKKRLAENKRLHPERFKCSEGHDLTWDDEFGWICMTCMEEHATEGYEGGY